VAGAGWRQWTRETLGIDLLQTFLQDQVVQRYTTASARAAALSTPSQGMVSYTDEAQFVSYYDAAGVWQPLRPQRWPIAQARQTSAVTGLALGWATIGFNVTDRDSHVMFSGTRAIVKAGQGGTYRVHGTVTFGALATGQNINSRILKNGATFPSCAGNGGLFGGPAGCQSVTGPKDVDMNPGDYFELQGYANQGPWATSVFADAASYLMVERIR
jgi:hypothetical protein